MKAQTSHKESAINRTHIITLALAMIIVLVTVLFVVFSVSGCKEQNALGSQNVNIPMPQMSNFVADSKSKVYHKMTCNSKPTKGQLVFFDSPVAAQREGYRPCRICRPNQP